MQHSKLLQISLVLHNIFCTLFLITLTKSRAKKKIINFQVGVVPCIMNSKDLLTIESQESEYTFKTGLPRHKELGRIGMQHPWRGKTRPKTVVSSCRAFSLSLLQYDRGKHANLFLPPTGFGWIPNIKSNPIPGFPRQFKSSPDPLMSPQHPPCVIITSSVRLLILDILVPTWRKDKSKD